MTITGADDTGRVIGEAILSHMIQNYTFLMIVVIMMLLGRIGAQQLSKYIDSLNRRQRWSYAQAGTLHPSYCDNCLCWVNVIRAFLCDVVVGKQRIQLLLPPHTRTLNSNLKWLSWRHSEIFLVAASRNTGRRFHLQCKDYYDMYTTLLNDLHDRFRRQRSESL